jgi:hypothetical protein
VHALDTGQPSKPSARAAQKAPAEDPAAAAEADQEDWRAAAAGRWPFQRLAGQLLLDVLDAQWEVRGWERACAAPHAQISGRRAALPKQRLAAMQREVAGGHKASLRASPACILQATPSAPSDRTDRTCQVVSMLMFT